MRSGAHLAGRLLVAALLLIGTTAAAAAQTVIIVRHAERADAGMQAASGADPALSLTGRERAHALVTALADAGITAIFVTQYQRTRQTAEPLAALLGITPMVAQAGGGDVSGEAAALAARVRTEHADGVVLIVGHSNTVPALVQAFGGPDVGAMADTEFDTLYLLHLDSGGTRLVRARYGVNHSGT
jgi:broad specificity phosphatase PhoE